MQAKMLSVTLLIGAAMLLAACNSGGNGGGSTSPAAATLSGVFVDGPVQGLGYSATPSGLSGVTDANGQYSYRSGDMVTFNIFGRLIGAAVPAAPIVTPLVVFNTTDLSDPRVVNLAQLLLTLNGGTPAGTNPIIVPGTEPQGFPTTIDFAAPGFDASFPTSFPSGLVSEADATVHLATSFKTLAVTIVNTGTVTSNPGGIVCTSGTCSSVFVTGTQVILSATGSGFTGWSGGCAGTGPCQVILTANTTVTATFSQTAASGRYLFMRDFATFPVSTVKAIDPANAGATPPIVSNTASAPIIILTSGWDGATAAYANTTATSLMYASGGKLWRVSAEKSSGVPGSASNPPVQVSSEAGATNVCGIEQIERATTGTTKLVYVLAGPDNDCFIPADADNVTKIVSVLDNTTTPPTTLPAGLVYVGPGHGPGYVVDMSTGNATGIFLLDVVNALTLKFMNLNTGVITTIQANMGHVFTLAQDTSDRVFLLGGPNHNQLYIYTVSTNSLVLLVNGASELVTGRPLSDGTNLYLAEQATGKLYRVPQNATGPSNVVTLLPGVGFPIGDPFQQPVGVYVTTNHVFLQTYVPCSAPCTAPNIDVDSSGLYRVPKAGGAATPIVTHAAGAGIFDVRSVSNLVYYNHKPSPTIPAASAIREDGTSVFSTSATICPGGCGHWSADVELSHSFRTGSRALSKRVLLVFAGPTQNSGTLFAFDALTGTRGANLGVVPATNPAVTALFGSSFIDSSLLMTGVQGVTGSNLLFFADTSVPGSLTQVPTLPAGSWQAVNIFGF